MKEHLDHVRAMRDEKLATLTSLKDGMQVQTRDADGPWVDITDDFIRETEAAIAQFDQLIAWIESRS